MKEASTPLAVTHRIGEEKGVREAVHTGNLTAFRLAQEGYLVFSRLRRGELDDGTRLP